MKGESGPSPLGFGFERSKIYLAQTSPKGTAGVYPFDLRTKKFGKLIFAHEKFDVASLVFDKKRKVLEGVRWVGDTNSIHFLDPAAKKEHEAIQRALGGKTTWLVDESADENRKLYLVESAETAPRYVLYDRKKRNIDELYDFVSSQRWSLYTAGNKLAWGDLRQDGEKERLVRNSPVRLADRFEDPVLLAHGRHDKVVPYKHSKQMKTALEDAGKKTELVIYEDSHGFVHQPNRIDFYQRLEKFLMECTAQRS